MKMRGSWAAVFAAIVVSCGSSDTTPSGVAPDAGPGGASPGGARPVGTVTSCFGNGCPAGKCDYPEDCAMLYPAPLTDGSSLCNDGATGGYCITVIEPLQKWAVQCTAGSATAKACPNVCGVGPTGALTCD